MLLGEPLDGHGHGPDPGSGGDAGGELAEEPVLCLAGRRVGHHQLAQELAEIPRAEVLHLFQGGIGGLLATDEPAPGADGGEAGFEGRWLTPADRRRLKIVATARGVNTLQDLQRQAREAEDRLFEALDENERQAFRTLLSRIACGVRDMDLAAAPCDVTPARATSPNPRPSA
ncbi:hypothetical protein [Streptomyces sp. NPDC020951]|uniref:hypothetical protein n=1 Tax=Streptomyces sp. NPDC020951 TaxID=3365104 RepID=UPI0037A40054